MRLLLALLLITTSVSAEDAPSPRLAAPAGVWEGTLDVGVVQLRLSFTITPTDDGYTAAMVSLDQGAQSIAMDEFHISGDAVTIAYKRGQATFAGTLESRERLAGTWTQLGRAYPLNLTRVTVATEIRRPQLPKPPFPYSTVQLKFENQQAGVTLAGTLFLPAGKPVAAVVTVSGSGPQDRDETLFGHKPFLVLGDALARRGIAVLRYDDRGVGESTGKQQGATSTDFAGDALAALACVVAKTGLPVSKVGIVGHSEGGLIGPMLAADHPDALGFVVALAGPGVSGADILTEQSVTLLRSAGVAEKPLAARRAFGERVAQAARENKPAKFALAMVAAAVEAGKELTPAERDAAGIGPTGVLALLAALSDPWQKAFLTTDPADYLKRVNCPLLMLFGGKDIQVDAAINSRAAKLACPAAVVDTFPNLNHLFQPATTGALKEYGIIETTIDPAVLTRIGDWVLATTKDAK